MLKNILLPMLLSFSVFLALPARADEPVSPDGENQIAAIDWAAARQGRLAGMPSVLSQADANLYRAIAAAQEKNDWAGADRLIRRLDDTSLVGDFLARRYLSEDYRPSAGELKAWLATYDGSVFAPDIRALAGQKAGRTARPNAAVLQNDESAVWEDFSAPVNTALPAAEQRKVSAFKARFRASLRQKDFERASALIKEGGGLSRLLRPVDIDEMKTAFAASLFGDGRDSEVLQWAEAAAERSGDVLPEAHWVAGLSLWRMDNHAAAARHFEAVANAPSASHWLSSAGAYWAARANLAAGRPEVVNHWLHLASANSSSFYGLLARRTLGQDIHYSWDARPFTDLDAEILMRVPAARRGLALLQIGDMEGAEDELASLADRAAPSLAPSLLALAHAAALPRLALRLSDREGYLYDGAGFPVPDWRPLNGWAVDKALILAIARQESGFNPRAKSPAGALGLMQLMPATARTLGVRGKLTDPAVSLEYGQRYVKRLLEDDGIRGNLLFLVASYNSGPGNVARWLKTIRHEGDALLFMESIPARETRAFVARVMANYWVYRSLLGQSSPSLASLASGDWPIYDAAASRLSSLTPSRGAY